MAMLSRRALDYLAQLHHEPPVPVAQVERKLIERGFTPYPAWLEFQDRFAGYFEPIGGDNVAVWGLMASDANGIFHKPNEIYVNVHTDGQVISISCADIHPSFGYDITPVGKFIGPPFPCESFAVKVERNALMWEFSNAGPVQRVYNLDGVSLNKLREQLLAELRPFHMPEASDKFANYYMSPDKLLLEALEVDTLKLLIRAEE
jgi:hypothetical protein